MNAIKTLYSQDQIQKRVAEMAQMISKDFQGESLCVVGLLEDSFVFMADLIRKIPGEVLCYFMKADVEEQSDQAIKVKRIMYSGRFDVSDKSVLLVGRVLDTGITLDYITKRIMQSGPPRVLKACYLVDKPKARRVSVNADYAGFVVDAEEPGFVVGFGLSRDDLYRNLPHLGLWNGQ